MSYVVVVVRGAIAKKRKISRKELISVTISSEGAFRLRSIAHILRIYVYGGTEVAYFHLWGCQGGFHRASQRGVLGR